MKKPDYFTKILFAVFFISTQLFAQEPELKTVNTSRSNIKNNKSSEVVSTNDQCVVRLITSESGCDIVFTNEIKSPRDAASGLPTGRRMHKPIVFSVNSSDNAVSEVVSPRDAASGLATGKRSPGNPIGGLTIKGGKNPGGNQFNRIVANNGQFSLPADCPDGDCDLILSWSWGASNSGSAKSYCQCHFILTMEAGACVAIKTKGTGASNN